ncbi:MAG: aspartate kinase [Methanobrevibacter sp.]|nr:aspartate kinase [Methanobrevibacter sp.]
MDLIVAKFGGTSVGDGSRIKKAAQSVVNEYMKGKQIVVVVSAVNKTTDELIDLSNDAIGENLTDRQKAEIMAMGELTSARLFSATVESLGVKSQFIDPYNDLWPIMTDSNSLEAKIDFATTNKAFKGIEELLNQGIIPVICGFLGKGPSGEITTLGRGGSDVSAFLIGHCLDANEVIIVTDVEGVMSTDPNKIKDAELLDEITVEEMWDLATHGAQVLHPHALKYKDPLISAKIINFAYGDLSAKGTRITGPFEGDMMKSVSLYKNPISLIALIGDGMLKKSGLLAKLTVCLASNNINIFGISAGQNSMTVFVEKQDSQKAYHLLHDWVIEDDVFSSLSLADDTTMITIVSPDFADETPGIISKITEPLRKNHINIIEISSSQTAIVLYVKLEDGKKAYELLNEVLE